MEEAAVLLHDPSALTLLTEASSDPVSAQAAPSARDVCGAVVSRVLDQAANQAAQALNLQAKVDHGVTQVVLVSPGLDTRPVRVQWPAGTLLMDLCPEPAAALAGAHLSPAHSSGQRHLRRLYSPLAFPSDLAALETPETLSAWASIFVTKDAETILDNMLTSNGYRTNQPSLWVMEGLRWLSSDTAVALLVALTSLIDTDSVVIGDLHDVEEVEASGLLSSLGLQATILSAREAGLQLGLDEELLSGPEAKQLMFTSIKRSPSQAQQDMYFSHVMRSEYVTEDGFDD